MGSGPTTTTQQNQQQQTQPWAPAVPQLQGLLGNLGNVNTGVSPNQTAALGTLTGAAQGLPNYSPQAGAAANSLFAGGGANNQAGLLQGAYGNLQNSLSPLTNPANLNPFNTPGFSQAYQTLGNDITNNVNDRFAAAGRDLSPANSTALARGLEQGQGGLIQGQYNQNVGNLMGASNSLFGAGPIELLRCPPTTQAGYHLALKPPGNAASNELFCRQRWATARASEPSVVQRWQDQGLRLKVCRRFLKLSGTDRMSPSAFRRALCVTGATPSQFKPGAARALYELVGAADVLDLSAGWGDRLVGFCAAAGTRRYLGIDPNEALHPLYRQAAQRYAGDKTVDLLCGPAEDVEIPADSFDMALTSPPYFQVEKYAEGSECAKNQSWARYPTMQQWRAGFLAPAMRAAWRGLRRGGVLAINLADVQTADGAAPLCRWLQEEVGALPGAMTMPTIGMRLQGSNYTVDRREACSGEPVWMWSKGLLAMPLCIVASQESSDTETEGLTDDTAER